MFCTNCGKAIGDTAKFCNFCGRPVIGSVNPQAQPEIRPNQTAENEGSVPINEPVPENTSESTAQSAESTLTNSTEQSVPVSEAPEQSVPLSEEPTQSVPLSEAAEQSVPMSEPIPSIGVSQPSYQPQNIAEPQQSPQTQPAPDNPPPERKYTFGHIMLCLIAVAIMAVVAGIFAGLYFSVKP